MIALIGNLDFSELLVIAVVALFAFGKNLPEVAMRGAVQLARARRALTAMWREAGLEDELRRVRREVERGVNLREIQAPHKLAKEAGRRYMQDIQRKVEADALKPELPAESTQPRAVPPRSVPAEGPDPEPRVSAPPAPPRPPEPAPALDLSPRPVRRGPRDDRREDVLPRTEGAGLEDEDRETA